MLLKTGGDLMPEDIDLFRSHHKRSFWEYHLERWQQSGLSQRAYCMEHELKSHQFYYWRRRIQKPHSDVSFLPVMLPEGSVGHNHTVRILMPNGCVIEMEGWQEPTQLEQLVSMVAAL
jgi:hypothetical protein